MVMIQPCSCFLSAFDARIRRVKRSGSGAELRLAVVDVWGWGAAVGEDIIYRSCRLLVMKAEGNLADLERIILPQSCRQCEPVNTYLTCDRFGRSTSPSPAAQSPSSPPLPT